MSGGARDDEADAADAPWKRRKMSHAAGEKPKNPKSDDVEPEPKDTNKSQPSAPR